MSDTRDEAACYLIQKRGLYYRPNAKGYTGIKDEAGRYTEAEARSRAYPNGPHGPRDGMEYMHEEDAPDYSPSCWPETKTAHVEKRIAALEEQVARLKAENAEARDRALEDAMGAITEAVWKHQGDDAYSRGLDEGARSQNRADFAAILALRSRPSPAPSEAVKIKPLVWEENAAGGWKRGRATAYSSTGREAVISRTEHGWLYMGDIYFPKPTLDDGLSKAKLAAERDYEARIRSALASEGERDDA